jgi:hypothetical protein
VYGGKPLQQLHAMRRQPDIHGTPVTARFAGSQILIDQSVYQTYRAVVLDLKAFGQLANRDVIPPWKAFDRQERLVLLRRQANAGRGFLAEMQELAQ